MARIHTQREARLRRHRRVRSKLAGSSERPRLCVFRSSTHIYAQVIDDTRGHTLAAASSLDPGLREPSGGPRPKSVTAALVGAALAQRARQAGVLRVVFDRGGYQYHGRVKALADGARSEGLEF